MKSPNAQATAIASMLQALGASPVESQEHGYVRIEAQVPSTISEDLLSGLFRLLQQASDRYGHDFRKDKTSVVWAEIDTRGSVGYIPPLPPACTIVGRPAREARVVVYTCAADAESANRTLAALKTFAGTQNWTTAHEAYDLVPLTTSRRARTGWRTVERALTDGSARGLIAQSEQEIASRSADRISLRTFIIDREAFAVYLGAHPLSGPAAVWSGTYDLVPGSVRQLKVMARMRLSMRRWPGDVDSAVEVLARLAANAIAHGRPADHQAPAQMHVHLSFTDEGDLLIDVEDPNPGFPDVQAALNGQRGRGLRDALDLGAELRYFLAPDGRSKTVRAVLSPGEGRA
ncbi:hypothetical protein M2164_000169 [Streptomyces sp. SAI-208]|uniref:ATP-binding protein n=1 Tax=Streptomyces sp. SAI-208 TaxID=2940550 RepID=UPI00247412F2|nr:ATP-binding protein [Streptomyces sp. SAI-208]MDH6604534.1 hypothetical protein [Streptomyces sp. SAI-208]